MSPQGPSKNVKVVALSDTDKDMFIGSLIYRVGLDMSVLQQLERAGKTQYDAIVPFMRDNDLKPGFTTPKHSCLFVEDINTADTLICVVDVTKANSDNILQLEDLDKAIGNGWNIVVLVESMHHVQWDPQPYYDLVTGLEAAFVNHRASMEQLRFVPISSAGGENFLDLSTKSPWYSDQARSKARIPQTVVQAIDD